MAQPRFLLLVVCSSDGFIAPAPGVTPPKWTSPEEQREFKRSVARLDWGFMGRTTHELAPSAERRRVIFTTSAPEPRLRGRHLWLDPSRVGLPGILDLLRPVHPPELCGILGGTRVHDWFLERSRIDEVELSVEPVSFGSGVPLFSGQAPAHPLDLFAERGFQVVDGRSLNNKGAELHRLTKAHPVQPAAEKSQ